MAIAAVMIAVAAISAGVDGQIISGRPTSTDLRVVYSSWTVKSVTGQKTTISQFSAPINGFIPLGEGLEAQLYMDGSTNNLSFGSTTSSLTGLGDLRLQVNKAFADDHFLLSGGLSAPTGEKQMKETEWAVVEQLSTDFLSFPSRQLGAGLGLNVLVGGAMMLGDLRCGAGVSYQYAGKYTPIKGREEYDPGDQISVNVGVGGGEVEATTWSTSAIFTTYSDAKTGGAKAFKQGKELQFQFALQHRVAERNALSGSVHYILRDRSTEYGATVDTIVSQLRRFGNEIGGSVRYAQMLGQNWSLAPAASLRVIGSAETGTGGSSVAGSNVLGISGTVGRRFDKSLFEVGVTYYTGKARGSTFTVNGLQVSSTLHLSL